MGALLIASILFNVLLVIRLVEKSNECEEYRNKASHWLQRYNEK